MSNIITVTCDICGATEQLKVEAPIDSYRYGQELFQIGWWSRPDFPEICPRHPQPGPIPYVPVATPPPCCDLHGRNCEPPAELCCRWCTEAAHDFTGFRTGVHGDGSLCSNRDLSARQ